MADTDFIITISGAALSLLFYENVRNCGDQMGFLLGETLEFVVKSYTDADNQIETVKIQNNIETVVTCPLPDILHDSVGRINKEKLKDFLRDNNKQVIGWFRFRRNVGLMPTMRDRILHKEFASHFSNGDISKEGFFVTCLLSSTTSNERGTHKFKHVFLRCKREIFEPVPLRINNLENNSVLQEGSDYKPPPSKRSSDLPDVFSGLVKSLNLDLTRTSDLDSAIIIQEAAEQYLNDLIPELCKSDLEVAELEKQIKEFKFNKRSKIIANLNNIRHETETDHIKEKEKRLEQISPLRKELPNVHTFMNNSAATSQAIATPKPKNTSTYIEESVNQSILRKTNFYAKESISQEPPPVNSVSDMKANVAETISNKNRRTNIESQIVKESICKNETNLSGVGRGNGKFVHGPTELKKGRRTSGPIATRSNSDKALHAQVPQQESSEAKCVKNITSRSPYNQNTKKKVNNTRKQDSTDNH